jgi:hypothetical protein
MKTDDLLNFALLAILGSLLFWQFGTKSGKEYLAKQKATRDKIKAEKAVPGYVSGKSVKYRSFGLGVVLYVGLVVLISLALGASYFVFAFLPMALLISVLFAFASLKIADTAEEKGRSWESFFWLSMLISPVLMWIISATIRDNSTDAKVQPREVVSSVPVSSQLEELKKMLDAGLITQADFEEKKKEILGRL